MAKYFIQVHICNFSHGIIWCSHEQLRKLGDDWLPAISWPSNSNQINKNYLRIRQETVVDLEPEKLH